MVRSHLFISYQREDISLVDRLCEELRSQDLEVWLDRESIRPGERWQSAIRTAIQNGGYFLACFSDSYVRRDKSYMNEELTLAIEELRQRSHDRVWFIPIRLTACDIPDRQIGAGESLRDLQIVDLADDWKDGVKRLCAALRGQTPVDPRAFLLPVMTTGQVVHAKDLNMVDRALNFLERTLDLQAASRSFEPGNILTAGDMNSLFRRACIVGDSLSGQTDSSQDWKHFPVSPGEVLTVETLHELFGRINVLLRELSRDTDS